MMHPDEGALQALLDDELGAGDRVALQAHLAVCAECARLRDALGETSAAAMRALLVLDVPPPLREARRSFVRQRVRQRWTGSLRRAAVVLVLAGGAASATLPGSPVRAWLLGERRPVVSEGLTDRPDAAAVEGVASDVAAPTSPAVSLPVEEAVTVSIQRPARGTRVRIVVTAGDRVRVTASGAAADARFRTANDRIEVVAPGAGELRLEVPQSAASVRAEVDGERLLHVERGRVHVTGGSRSASGTTLDIAP